MAVRLARQPCNPAHPPQQLIKCCTARTLQADRREGAKSVGLPGSFSLTVAPSTGINMGYSGTAVCTAASLERVVSVDVRRADFCGLGKAA